MMQIPFSFQVSVSLHPSGKKEEARVKQLQCVESNLRQFRQVDTDLSGGGGDRFLQSGSSSSRRSRDDDDDCLLCPETWSFYSNPLNWSSRGGGMVKAVVITVLVAGVSFVIYCCVNVLCCLRRCSS